MRSIHKSSRSLRRGLGTACALGLLLTASLSAQESYGFVRVVEGYADLVQGSSQSVVELTANYPILVGDQLRVSQGGRLEAVLPDGSYLRLGANTELALDRIAMSEGTADEATLFRLAQGEIQIVVHEDLATATTFRIDTANASVYLQKRGIYRIFTDGASWTEVVVRDGFAEVLTERGSAVVRTGEQTVVDGSRWPTVTVAAAGPRDTLERWGDRLLAEATIPEDPGYVAPALSYAAAPLYRHGSWVAIGSRRAWRPYVSVSWRPYHAGWWVYTPSGLTWVSTEPWGWVTYHYGLWDFDPGFGWVWYPGQIYTPAAVYWYWGPTHVGWIPAGYYLHHYGYWGDPYRAYYGPRWGFSYGIHGWAGGYASFWSDWTFCSYEHFGHRYSHSYVRTGAQLTRQGTFRTEVPRGIIATDTRALKPELWKSPSRAIETLKTARLDPSMSGTLNRELPDVSSWVARQPKLTETVSKAVQPSRTAVTRPGSVNMEERGSRRPDSTIDRSRDGFRQPSSVRRIDSDWRAARPKPVIPERSTPRIVGPAERDARAAAPSRTRSLVPQTLQPRDQVSTPRMPTREWDPGVWRRDFRTRPAEPAPGAPQARALRPGPPSASETPVVRRVWEGVRNYRLQERSASPRGSVGSPPSTGRYPSARPTPGAAPSRVAPQGRTPSPSPPSAARPSRPSGSRPSGNTRGGSQSQRRPSSGDSSSRPPS